MKKYTVLNSVIALLIVVLSVFVIQRVSATVGGETLIYDFTYNPKDESVYYTQNDDGGRGCPPELRKISLNSEVATTVFSCDQGEKLSLEQVQSAITTTTSTFKPLLPLHLKSNAITIKVQYVNDETYGSESSDILLRNFITTVYQNGKKVKEFPITGCSKDQPFTFQGYSIPGFNKKILLLISAKNNCAEGGYIFETLKVIDGVDSLDKTVTGTFYKRSSPLLPNEGNLVIYESTTVKPSDTATTITITSQPKNVAQGGTISVSLASLNAPKNSAVALYLVNVNTNASMGIIAHGKDASDSFSWTVPFAGSRLTCADCGGVQKTPPAGTYKIIANLYTPTNAWLGDTFPPEKPITPKDLASVESATFEITAPKTIDTSVAPQVTTEGRRTESFLSKFITWLRNLF